MRHYILKRGEFPIKQTILKIFSAIQIKDWDQATLEKEGISGTDLMDRAAEKCFLWIWHRYNQRRKIFIFCGKGNNGGDGLAIARLLLMEAYDVHCIFTHPTTALSPDARWQLDQVQNLPPFPVPKGWDPAGQLTITDIADFSPDQIDAESVIIDAMFGTGLKRSLSGAIARLAESINQLPNIVIAIDLPSGMAADRLPDKDAVVLKAKHTLTFESYKHSFFHAAGARYAGKIHVLSIDLSRNYYKRTTAPIHALDGNMIRKLYRPRDPFGHKGSFGTAVLVGGSYGKIGSIGMSAKAALRVGAGKVFIQAPKCGDVIVQTYIPEAMFQSMGEGFIEYITPLEKAIFGIGPGLGQEQESSQALRIFLQQTSQPLVLDADALNLIAQHPEEMLPLIPSESIITPHPKEFERLFGATENTLEQVQLARKKAQEYQFIIVLKGHHTAICLPDGRVYYNMTGNAGMATAGSGDVLTGMITGLLAQSYLPKNAALLAVYLHGLAGDLAAKDLSKEATIAGDLMDYFGAAYKLIKKKKK